MQMRFVAQHTLYLDRPLKQYCPVVLRLLLKITVERQIPKKLLA